VAFVACAGLYAVAAERATFILTDGERVSGTVVFHTNTRENLIDGDFSLGRDDGGKEMIFHADQVAVIAFAGGQPGPNELAQLPGSGQFIVLRDGTSQPGRFVNMIGGDTVIWENLGGQRQRFAIRDVSRVYLNPQSARTVFNYNNYNKPAPTVGAAVGTTGLVSRTVTVDARQAWTDTGITVNQGDRVVFQASGEIRFGRGPGQTATPNGGSERRAIYPDPTVPVGALIGKIGKSAPFGIGTQTEPLPMPASGRLLLGVNDNELGDNSGFFTVIVTKQ
jgi:hypothetical protein